MRNLFGYEGKRCLVVGCFSGMGEATARVVRSLGGSVVAADIQRPTTFDFESFHEIDLRDARAIERMVKAVASNGPIDRLFYCAGLPGTKPKLDVMLVNFIGLRHTVETCAPHMPRDGAIATISSAGGMGYLGAMQNILPLLATKTPEEARKWVEENLEKPWLDGYAFSKMCTIVYTLQRGPRLTMETGIRLNCISPGPTDTPMMPAFIEQTSQAFMDAYPKPIGRNSTAEEQAWPLAFLNSDAASHVSGENLYTDGGGAGGLMTGSLTVDLSGIAAPVELVPKS